MKIGNPGAGNEFDGAVYDRGAMTLQALRTRVGNPAFFTIMRTWAAKHRYGNGSIPQFVKLAEKMSGKDLGSFFDAWLFTAARPAPTKANGFPADFAASATSLTRPAALPSEAKIARARELLAQQRD